MVALTENKVMINDGKEMVFVETEQIGDDIKLKKIGSNNDGYFLIDRNAGTMYSSYTGKTLQISDLTEKDEQGTISPMGVTDIVATYTEKVSYKTLADLVGKTMTAYDIAYALAGIYLAAHGIAIAPIITILYNVVKGQLYSQIVAGIGGSLPGGIKVTIYKCEITKHQGGRTVKGYGYQMGSFGLYR